MERQLTEFNELWSLTKAASHIPFGISMRAHRNQIWDSDFTPTTPWAVGYSTNVSRSLTALPHVRMGDIQIMMQVSKKNMFKCQKFQLTWSRGVSTTSRSFSICSLQPPTSLYVTSGFSSTCIMVTVGSIFGGRGMWIWYLLRSTLQHGYPPSTNMQHSVLCG